MELGIYTDSVASLELPTALDLAARIGAKGVEIATGGQSSAPHLRIERLLASADERARFLDELERRGLHLSALNCSAWLLHPRLGSEHRALVEKTIRLAELLGVRKIVTMSGCPGDGSGAAQLINWPWYPWPDELVDLRERQWEEVVALWRELAPFALDHGVERVALELHPLQVVYNAPTLLALREAVGPAVGANLDPSHLFWQQMDALAAARALGRALHHIHLKDAEIMPDQVALAGVLDHRTFDRPEARAWNFRVVGAGHDAAFWRAFVAALRQAGYDGVLSIEHEDRSMDPVDGVTAAADLMRPMIG